MTKGSAYDQNYTVILRLAEESDLLCARLFNLDKAADIKIQVY